MSGGGPGEEHDRGRCGPCAECLAAARMARWDADRSKTFHVADPSIDPAEWHEVKATSHAAAALVYAAYALDPAAHDDRPLPLLVRVGSLVSTVRIRVVPARFEVIS